MFVNTPLTFVFAHTAVAVALKIDEHLLFLFISASWSSGNGGFSWLAFCYYLKKPRWEVHQQFVIQDEIPPLSDRESRNLALKAHAPASIKGSK